MHNKGLTECIKKTTRSIKICFFLSVSFSPLKFSQAGPFKSSMDGEPDLFSPTSPSAAPVTVQLENGAASQPIRTPARNKKQKGHRRWEGQLMSQRALQDCGQINIFIVHSRCRGIELNSVLFCLYHAFWSGLTNNRCTWGYYSGLPVCCRTIRR